MSDLLCCRVGTLATDKTASAKTDDIISQAARMSRKRGRIVLVGFVGRRGSFSWYAISIFSTTHQITL